MLATQTSLPLRAVGHDELVPTTHGQVRGLALDAAASTPPLQSVAARVDSFLPWYSSVHRGAGYKSQFATNAYEEARRAALSFAGRNHDRDTAIFVRNTTDAVNTLAYRLRLEPDDVVVTTVLEHHANLLPWARVARRRFIECGTGGTFDLSDVERALDAWPRARLLAITGASNVTGWLPPLDEIIAAAHARGVEVFVDGAQLAPHRPIPPQADFIAWSGHKMYAPYGAGVLVGPRAAFADGDPFLHGGGAVRLVDLDEVVWTDAPDRDEAGSPNVIGAVAIHAAIDALDEVGWDALIAHEEALARRMRVGLASIDRVRLLGPSLDTPTLACAAFTVEGIHHAFVAARLSVEHGIAVRHGCFCAHPYLMRLLGLSRREVGRFRSAILSGNKAEAPGAVRASAGLATSEADIERFLDAVRAISSDQPPPVAYVQDPATGEVTSPEAPLPFPSLGLSSRCNG